MFGPERPMGQNFGLYSKHITIIWVVICPFGPYIYKGQVDTEHSMLNTHP